MPRSLALSVLGTKLLSKRPVAVIVSEVALPRLTFPFAFNTPPRSRLPVMSVSSFKLI